MNKVNNSDKVSTPILLSILLIGIVLRTVLLAASYGTNDVDSWQRFAEQISGEGLFSLYSKDHLFNHPPLGALLVTVLYKISLFTGIAFTTSLRLATVFADIGTLLLLSKITSGTGSSEKVISIYAVSLISILISGYHGNTDSIYAFLALLAIYLFEDRRSYLLAGAVLGLATNIKLIPVMLLIPMILKTPTKKDTISSLFGFFLMMLPFLLGVIFGGESFVKNVLQYKSQLDYWGIQLFLLLWRGNSTVGDPGAVPIINNIIELYLDLGRYLVFGLIFLVSVWLRRRANLYELACISFAIFAVFAPGFAGQYFAVFAPLVVLISIRWGIILTTATGLGALSSYLAFAVDLYPFHSVHNSTAPKGVVLLSFFVWYLLIIFLSSTIRTVLKREDSTVEINK